jgi:phage shock protein C
VAGVCAGIADYFGLDATLIRVIFVVLAFFGGFGLVAYVVGWALVPEEGESASIAESFINKGGAMNRPGSDDLEDHSELR